MYNSFMHSHVRIFTQSILILFGCVSLSAAPKSIDMDMFLDQIRKQHPYLEELNAQNKSAEKSKKATKGSQDWLFTQRFSHTYNEPVSIGLQFYSRTEQSSSNSSLSKNIWSTGANVSIGTETQYLQQTQSDFLKSFGSASPEDYYLNKVFLQYRQPLWQNLGGTLFKYDFNKAYQSQKQQSLQNEELSENFFKNMKLHFIQWAYLAHTLELATKRVALAEESFAQSQKRFKANLVDEVDLIRAETALNNTKIEALNAKANYQAKAKELAKISFVKNLVNYRPSFELFTLKSFQNLDKSKSIDSTRPLQTLAIEIKKAQLDEAFFKEKMKPDLALVLYGAKDDANEKLNDLIQFNNDSFRISLDYQIPLGKTTHKNQVSASHYRLQALEAQRKNTLARLHSQKEILLTRLEYLRQRIRLSQKQLKLAKALTQEETRLYLQGKKPIFQTIQAQDAEQGQKLIYANFVFSYHQSYLELEALLDVQ